MTDEQKAKMSLEHRCIVDICTLAEHLFETIHAWEKLGDELSQLVGDGSEECKPPKIDEDGSGLASVIELKKKILEVYS